MDKKIALIIDAPVGITDPRDTAELHGGVFAKTGKKIEEKLDQLGDSLDKAMEDIGELLEKVKNKTLEGWEVGEVTVGIAISAEGSIGIATAGVEASIEVTFKPK